jgi:hypothetical protein
MVIHDPEVKREYQNRDKFLLLYYLLRDPIKEPLINAVLNPILKKTLRFESVISVVHNLIKMKSLKS